jgi:hypothetical protein
METAVSFIQTSSRYSDLEQRRALNKAIAETDMRPAGRYWQSDVLPEQVVSYVSMTPDIDCLVLMTEEPLGSTEEEIESSYRQLLSSGTDVLVLAD